MEPEPEKKKNLFSYMLAGQKVAKEVREEAIFLVGITRVGKSTLYNYLKGVTLVPKYEEGEYIYESAYEKVAETKGGFDSVTLIANISKSCRLNEVRYQVGLCDMAGFSDHGRSYLGVYMVSYMLRECFNQAKKMKFILVIEHSTFASGELQTQKKPFQKFIQMLDHPNLACCDSAKDNLFKSVAIVVSKAQKGIDYYRLRMRKVAQGIPPKARSDKYIVQLLEKILNDNRIELFQQATSEPPRKSVIIEKLSARNCWNFYDFSDTRNNISATSLFKLPFREQYEKLSKDDKRCYTQDIEKRKNSYAKMGQILQKYLQVGISKLNKKKDKDKKLQKVNQELEKFVQQYDYYGKDEETQLYIFDYLKLQQNEEMYEKKEFTQFSLMRKIKQIYDKTMEIGNLHHEGQAKKDLENLKPYFFDLLTSYLKLFPQGKKNVKLFIYFMFICIKGIDEFISIVEIDQMSGAQSCLRIKNQIGATLREEIESVERNFLNKFKPKIEEKEQFENYVNNFLKECQRNGKVQVQEINLLKNLIKMNIKSGKIHETQAKQAGQEDSREQKKQRILALKMYIKANQNLQKFKNDMLSLSENYELSPKDDSWIEECQISIYYCIGRVLEDLDKFPLAHDIYEHLRCVESKIKCFEKSIQKASKVSAKNRRMKSYAEYCEKYGRIEQAIEIYQKLIKQLTFCPHEKKQIKAKICGFLQRGRLVAFDQYREKLMETVAIENKSSLIRDIRRQVIDCDGSDDSEQSESEKNSEEKEQEDFDQPFQQQWEKWHK